MKNRITLLTLTFLIAFNLSAQKRANKDVVNAASLEENMDQIRSEFLNPGNNYRALPLGLRKISDVPASVEKLTSGRWGGIHAPFPQGGSGYLIDSTGWKSYRELIRKCSEKGLKAWIYDENGYPSGRAGHKVLAGHPEFEAQGMFYASKDFQIKETRSNDNVREVEWRIPDGVPFLVVQYALNREGHIVGNPLDLTSSVKGGAIRTTLKQGSWRLIAFVQNRLFDGTHASLTGGPYINILDPQAVKRFIEITHESYYTNCGEEFGKTITAIFNDEVSVMNGFLTDDSQPYPAISWYHGFPELFKQRCGYDIRECLPALFDDTGSETIRKRCDFYSFLGQQIANSFFKQIREWCSEHQVASIGHLLWEESLIYHAHFYGTVFPSYKELDWPGIDELGCQYGCMSGSHTEGGPVTPKLASSAAHIWGKPRTMSESFCFVTNKTPIEEVIAQYNWEAVLGINSLTTITIQESFSNEELGRLNDCVGRLNYMLTRGKYSADMAILYPIASVWAGFKPTTRHVHNLNDNPKAKDVDEAWRYVSYQALSCQRDFDYLDEDLILSADINKGKLKIGNNYYSTLVLPNVTCLNFNTLNKIKNFVDNGGCVISWQTLPWDRTDAGPSSEQKKLVEELWNKPKGKIIHTITETELRNALMNANKPDLVITPSSTEIYYQHRVLPKGDIYFLVNNSLASVSGDMSFRANGKAELWDPATGKGKITTSIKTLDGSKIKMTMAPRSGIFVVFNRQD